MIIRTDAAVKFFIDLSNKNAIKGISEVETKSEALAKKFNSAGKALTIGLTTPIVAFGTYAVKTASDFDSASSQIQSSLGLSTGAAKEFGQVLKDIYNAGYGESYEDVANKISYVAQATGEIDPSKIKELTTNAMALEDTFGSDFNETIRGVSNLMTHFGLSSEEAFDLFAKGSQVGLDYTDELGDNIAEYGGNFKQAGYSAEEYFQLLANGTKNGAYNLDKVNDSINEVKNRLGDGTIKSNLEMFSSDTQKAFKNWENGKVTMKDVINSIVNDISTCKNEQDQLTMAATAFGTMGEDANLKVVTSLTTVGDEFSNVKGAMDGVKEVKYDNLGSMLESLKRQLGDVALEAGNELMPAIEEIISGLQGLVTWFKNLSPETKEMIGNILQIATVIGPTLILFSKMVSTVKDVSNAFGTFGSAISKVTGKDSLLRKGLNSGINTLKDYAKYLKAGAIEAGKMALEAGKSAAQFIVQKTAMLASTIATKAMAVAQGALNLVMSMNPITLIIIAIVALIAIIVLLWTKCEWFRDGVMAVISTIWSVIQSVASFIMNIFSTVFSFIWAIVQNYVNFWITVWSTIFNVVSTVLTTIWNTIQSVFNFIWGIVSSVINNIISAFKNVANIVKSVFTNVKNSISNLFKGAVNVIKSPINGLISVVNKVIKGLNKIKMPDWVPSVGGKGINIPLIPKLASGTNYVAREGLAYLHEGEAVVPKKYNPVAGAYGMNNTSFSGEIVTLVNLDGELVGRGVTPYVAKTFKTVGVR